MNARNFRRLAVALGAATTAALSLDLLHGNIRALAVVATAALAALYEAPTGALAVVHEPVGVTGTGPLDGTEMVAGTENTVKEAGK